MSELMSALYQTVYDGASRVVKKVQKNVTVLHAQKEKRYRFRYRPDFILSVVQTFG